MKYHIPLIGHDLQLVVLTVQRVEHQIGTLYTLTIDTTATDTTTVLTASAQQKHRTKA